MSFPYKPPMWDLILDGTIHLQVADARGHDVDIQIGRQTLTIDGHTWNWGDAAAILKRAIPEREHDA